MSETSSAGEQPPVPAPTSSVRLIATLGVIALISGLLIVSVVEWTRPMIDENREQMRQEAIREVIPGASQFRDYVLTDAGLRPAAEAEVPGPLIHLGYNEAGELQGAALEASGRGYEDVIRILYGYDPACECVLGMEVIESQETPGLGDRIEDDPQFHASIEGLDLSLDERRDGLAHAVRVVDPGESEASGEIDGITGATVSAEAIGAMIHDSAERLLPRLDPYWPDVKGIEE